MTVRETALALLTEHEASGKYSNLALRSHLADSLEGKDRAFLTVLFYTALEHRLTYDYLIASLAGKPVSELRASTRNILRLGLCQLMHISSVPEYAAVNETVRLAKNKGEASFVNGILRAFLRAKENNSLPMPDKDKNYVRYLSVKESFSTDIIKALIKEFGQKAAEDLLRHFNGDRATDITVNTLKISRSIYIKMLNDAGLNAEASGLSSIGVRIGSSVDPRGLVGYNEGMFFVQDGACSAAAEVLSPDKGELIIDVCSAPGGKSHAAAILAGDKADIYSFDLHESKISLIADGAERLGLKSVKASVCDALDPKRELIGRADKVICDVPCSGLGVLGKKSDIRYKNAESFAELPELQYAILKSSAGYLKPGGRLLYSTCTLRSEENADVVNRFIAENEGFKLIDFKVGDICSEGGMLTLLPHVHKTDGFFISLIERENQ